MTERPKRAIADCATGETIIQELTDEEIIIWEREQKIMQEERAAFEMAMQEKENRKKAAISKLKALGLTEDEVTALL